MYEAKNHKELKKLLEEGKTPIHISDSDTIKVVETLESLKKQGVVATAKRSIKEKILDFVVATSISPLISESTVIILGIITASSLIALYAIYKDKNIKIKYNPNGTIELETN